MGVLACDYGVKNLNEGAGHLVLGLTDSMGACGRPDPHSALVNIHMAGILFAADGDKPTAKFCLELFLSMSGGRGNYSLFAQRLQAAINAMP